MDPTHLGTDRDGIWIDHPGFIGRTDLVQWHVDSGDVVYLPTYIYIYIHTYNIYEQGPVLRTTVEIWIKYNILLYISALVILSYCICCTNMEIKNKKTREKIRPLYTEGCICHFRWILKIIRLYHFTRIVGLSEMLVLVHNIIGLKLVSFVLTFSNGNIKWIFLIISIQHIWYYNISNNLWVHQYLLVLIKYVELSSITVYIHVPKNRFFFLYVITYNNR